MLSLHYNGVSSYLFVNGIEIYKFKVKYSEISVAPLCLGNISKDFLADDILFNQLKKTGLYKYAYHFSVDYDSTGVNDILDIYK